MPTASMKITPEFVTVALQRYRQQHRGRNIGFVIKLILLLLLAPIIAVLFWQGNAVIGFLIASLGCFMFFAQRVDYWLARRSFKNSPSCGEEVTIELTDAAFHVLSPTQDTKLQWSVFTKAAHFKDGFLLFSGPKEFHWLPLSSLREPSQAADVNLLLRSKIIEHVAVEVCSTERCRACGYDLTGNVSGICPECGTLVPRRAADATAAVPLTEKNEQG